MDDEKYFGLTPAQLNLTFIAAVGAVTLAAFAYFGGVGAVKEYLGEEQVAVIETATPAPTEVPAPTSSPSPEPTSTPAPTVAPPPPCETSAPSNPHGYDFCSSGNFIYDPPGDMCTYIACIGNFWNGVGYVIQCKDGMFSKSGGRSGSCSYHGGNFGPLYSH